jgi:hypothetical protein
MTRSKAKMRKIGYLLGVSFIPTQVPEFFTPCRLSPLRPSNYEQFEAVAKRLSHIDPRGQFANEGLAKFKAALGMVS